MTPTRNSADLMALPEPEYVLTSIMGNFISFRAKGFNHKKGDGLYTADQMRQAILNEREACAKLCDDQGEQHTDFRNTQAAIGCDGCADAIRDREVRGETKK